jgi:hypothetical protein
VGRDWKQEDFKSTKNKEILRMTTYHEAYVFSEIELLFLKKKRRSLACKNNWIPLVFGEYSIERYTEEQL